MVFEPTTLQISPICCQNWFFTQPATLFFHTSPNSPLPYTYFSKTSCLYFSLAAVSFATLPRSQSIVLTVLTGSISLRSTCLPSASRSHPLSTNPLPLLKVLVCHVPKRSSVLSPPTDGTSLRWRFVVAVDGGRMEASLSAWKETEMFSPRNY